MVEVRPEKAHVFSLQKQTVNPSRQPLEIYHLSHDLRGPLNSILGFSELLLEGIEGPLNNIQQEDIAAIRQSAQNLLQLINALVDLSKLEADKLALTFGSVQIHDVVQKVLKAQAIVSRSGQIQMAAHVPESLPPVWGDSDRIEQMILSLAAFALKIQGGGSLEITARHDDQEATLQITAPILVMPPEQLEELFDLSVKIDPAGRGELGKGGLFLPLVQALAERQRGQVWAESRAGSGTIFYLKLPLHQPEQ